MFSRDKDSATGTGIPDSYGFIPAHRGDAFAIGRPRQRFYLAIVIAVAERTTIRREQIGEDILPGSFPWVPHQDLSMPPGSHALAIGRPGEGSDTIRMLIIGENTSAHGQVPHLYRLIITGGSKELSVGRPGHAKHSVAMTPAGEQVLPGGGIPHLHRLIITRRGDTSAIGRPGDGSHTGGMTTTDAQGGSQGLSGSWASNDCRSDLQGIRVKTSSRTSG